MWLMWLMGLGSAVRHAAGRLPVRVVPGAG